MKQQILPLLVFFVVAMVSCSPEYKLGQTPDDVYYSPAKPVEEAMAQKQDDRYQENMNYVDDRYLRMKVHNYSYWSPLDDYAYWNDIRYDFSPYTYNYSPYKYALGFGSTWGFNYGFYNPYFYCGGGYNYSNPVYYVGNYKNIAYNPGSNSGSYLSAYKNKTYNNANYNYNSKNISNQMSSSGFGTVVRRILSPSSPASSSGYNTSWDRSARTFTSTPSSTFTPSRSAGSSSGGYGSSGSSAGGGRAPRNN